ncbi:MAG: sigma-70 family RNA polymerase sigma factor [Rhodobiaceae bacterium]|nr:sigma-70 family RNA polymerase sigma factor [Rhodobiaceae bacterium]
MSDDQDISSLISRVALGDRAAFRALYKATSAKLFGVILRILKDRAESEDSLQEVYVKVWRNAGRFSADGASPMAWLIAIARNQAIDRIRARRPEAVDVDMASELPDDRPDPERQTIAASERRRIELCLEQLDPARADAVRGAYLEGYSYQDLADRHAIPINTMRTWLRRSLAALRECLSR